MSTNSTLKRERAVTAPEEPVPQTPTVTYYEQLAHKFMQALDDIAEIIPKLEASHESTAAFVHSYLSIPNAFLATAISAVEQHATLQAVQKLDLTAAHDTLQFLEAFKPVLDKLTGFQRALKFTLNSRKALLAADSLQIYDVAKGLARDPGSADMAAHVGNMKRDLGRRGRPKKKPAAGMESPAAAETGPSRVATRPGPDTAPIA
jgi:hypothetical protein